MFQGTFSGRGGHLTAFPSTPDGAPQSTMSEGQVLGVTAGAADEGEITMYVAIFGSVDKVNDRIMHGAFDVWLKSFKSKRENVLPVIWSHAWGDAAALIGYATPDDVEVDNIGLKVRARVDLTNPTARVVYNNAKRGVL